MTKTQRMELAAVAQLVTAVLYSCAIGFMTLVNAALGGQMSGVLEGVAFAAMVAGPIGLFVTATRAVRSDYQWAGWFINSLVSTILTTAWSLYSVAMFLCQDRVDFTALILMSILTGSTVLGNLSAFAIYREQRHKLNEGA